MTLTWVRRTLNLFTAVAFFILFVVDHTYPWINVVIFVIWVASVLYVWHSGRTLDRDVADMHAAFHRFNFAVAQATADAEYPESPSITCPVCFYTSFHPQDIEHGYCGYCHWWTSDPELAPHNPAWHQP